MEDRVVCNLKEQIDREVFVPWLAMCGSLSRHWVEVRSQDQGGSSKRVVGKGERLPGSLVYLVLRDLRSMSSQVPLELSEKLTGGHSFETIFVLGTVDVEVAPEHGVSVSPAVSFLPV